MITDHALLISIRPRFVKVIFEGTKTVELRRVKTRLKAGDLVVIYASGDTKGIVGAFEVEGVTTAAPAAIWKKHNAGSGLDKAEFDRYFEGAEVGYAIQIGKLWQFPTPVLLGTLRKRRSGFRPPQSYHYWEPEELRRVGGKAFSAIPRRTLKARQCELGL